MPAVLHPHRQSLLRVLDPLRPFHSAPAVQPQGPRVADGQTDGNPDPFPDDQDALPRSRCVSVWSLVEECARLRSDWY